MKKRPKGFKASGVVANIKSRKKERKDLALLFSETPATAAGIFTQNIVKAAPLLVTQRVIEAGLLQAIVINSGNANACTGEAGIDDAQAMCRHTAELLGIDQTLVGVASTGVIGVPLPMDRIHAGIADAALHLTFDGEEAAALAIMTTDTFSKQCTRSLMIGEKEVVISGIAKGSGMVHPNMATILGFLLTDAAITLEALQQLLKRGADLSFNMISVDGDTSTNDLVLALANGRAENPLISLDSPYFESFAAAFEEVLIFLAKEIARDGEGSTKLLEVTVEGAATEEQARLAARAVSRSSLVKTALFGNDANWGRILCALGYSGAIFNPMKVTLFLGHLQVMDQGRGVSFNEEDAYALLSKEKVMIKAHLGEGVAEATAWGCDLSYDYIKINGAYRT